MLRHIKQVLSDAKDKGASAVEYGLIVAAIAAVIVGLVFTLGGIVSGAFKDTNTAICFQADGTTPRTPTPTGCED